eukprot:TRINITY_DN7519_c0_g1_i11.p1 TRINITY_DN7519_c0_g1~~TRINITY_DN7519_c0_g1_i11.p1  ORF type:complete len:691 (+),score=102.11 TRINITY_DN7519_c0_g1_i11:60-2132(+)
MESENGESSKQESKWPTFLKSTDVRNCAVRGCKNSSRGNPDLKFYILPFEVPNVSDAINERVAKRRALWLERMRRKDPGLKSLYLCDKHFEKPDTNARRTRGVENNLAPTLFLDGSDSEDSNDDSEGDAGSVNDMMEVTDEDTDEAIEEEVVDSPDSQVDIVKSEPIEEEIVHLDEPSESIDTPSCTPITPLVTPQSTPVVTPMIVETSSAQRAPCTIRIASDAANISSNALNSRTPTTTPIQIAPKLTPTPSVKMRSSIPFNMVPPSSSVQVRLPEKHQGGQGAGGGGNQNNEIGGGFDLDFDDEEPPPLVIVPEVSLGNDQIKEKIYSQEVEITEECVELMKDKMDIFEYKCNLCELSTSYVTGNIYFIRSRNGNAYYPCEMCQYVKISLQSVIETYMSKVIKKVHRDGSETLSDDFVNSYDPDVRNRAENIKKSRKIATDFVAKFHLGLGAADTHAIKPTVRRVAGRPLLTDNSRIKSPSVPSASSTNGAVSSGTSSDNTPTQRFPNTPVIEPILNNTPPPVAKGSITSDVHQMHTNSQPHVDLTARSGQEKKYQCDYCPYTTTTFYRLQQHTQKDHNVERHICPQVKCNFEAEDEATLKEHVLNVHEGSRFPCHLCSFLATRKATLKTHIESIHEGVKYPCNYCGYAATQISALRRHIRNKHMVPGRGDGVNQKNSRRPYSFHVSN